MEKVGATDAWFVAGHWWDVAGASFAGLQTAWISRTDIAYPVAMPEPHVRGADLAEVAAGNPQIRLNKRRAGGRRKFSCASAELTATRPISAARFARPIAFSRRFVRRC